MDAPLYREALPVRRGRPSRRFGGRQRLPPDLSQVLQSSSELVFVGEDAPVLVKRMRYRHKSMVVPLFS
jgi:hypothetical protein